MALTETWLRQVIADEVAGVDLVMLERVGAGDRKVVRLYIDHADGVTHELCGKVSEAVGRALDETDALQGPYALEVSSPGLERPLSRPEHFEAQVGKKVYVKSRVAVDGAKVHRGLLAQVTSDAVVVEEEGQQVQIRLRDISKAHLIYEFE